MLLKNIERNIENKNVLSSAPDKFNPSSEAENGNVLLICLKKLQVSEDHHSTVLLRKCMFPWRQHAEEVMQEKFMMASKQYELILIRGAMNSWKRVSHQKS